MKFVIGHVRVSSNKQFDYGDSIEVQQQQIEQAAKLRGYVIGRWFIEHYSGRKSERIIIDDMLSYLSDNNDDVHAVIIPYIERFTRGGGDNYLYLRKELFKLGVELMDAHGVIQKTQNALAHLGFDYEWSSQSPSRMAEVMAAETAYDGGRKILIRTIGQEIKLTKEGYHVRPANLGFKNAKVLTPDGKKRPILVPDEIEAPWFYQMYDLLADGQITDDEICARVNAMGFKTRVRIKRHPRTREMVGTTGGQPLNPKKLKDYAANPIYCGVKIEKWTNYEPIRTPFPGLVSIDTFNRANRGKIYIHENKDGSLAVEYNKRKHRRSPDNPDFRLRHVVRCPNCGKPFMGSFSTNKQGKPFGYYHCSRSHKRVSVSKSEFESTLGLYFEKVKFKPAYFGLFKETIREVWKEKNQTAQVEVKAAIDHEAILKAQQDQLIAQLVNVKSVVVIRKLESEIEKLEQQIKNAEKHKDQFEIKADQIEAYFEFSKKALEHAQECVKNASTRAKLEKVWRFIFSAPTTYEDFKSGTPQLSLLYRLAQGSPMSKKEMAYLIRKNWNIFEDDMKRFLYGHS